MTAELVALDLEDLDPQTRRVLAIIDRIDLLAARMTADRDEMQARLSAAALFLRHAIAAATVALDGYDHTQPHQVHDAVVETLAHLRTLQSVLAGTPPDTREVPTRNRSRH